MEAGFSFRKARVEDAEFIACCVLAGIGEYEFGEAGDPVHLASIAAECRMEESLYSYRNALIFLADGLTAGCLISYPGEMYKFWRDDTWKRIDDATGASFAASSEYETCDGEYYLDTLVLRPEYRGRGLGRQIIAHQIAEASQRGHRRFTLIVEKDHPRLVAYYGSMGFEPESEMTFLGERYLKCVYSQSSAL